ncbi:uncharacterized protein LOC128217938 [Mya arenaria]|uniref:uncharacterized protein LOC128217938 n=1 Tax=Mya arenaria TaxID=6604 RepID=UPI0022E925D6|nr:uncharacterized protein LOC128217938 [Mya arenaria]
MTIQWWMPSTKFLKYVMLEILYLEKVDEKFEVKREHVLININITHHSGHQFRKDDFVSYTCLNVNQATIKVDAKLWALGLDTRLEGHDLTASVSKYSEVRKPASARVSMDYNSRIAAHEKCVCKTKLSISATPLHSNMRATISAVDGTLPKMTLKLVRSMKYSEETFLVSPERGQTNITQQFDERPQQDVGYNILVIPECPLVQGYLPSCGLIEPDRIISSKIVYHQEKRREQRHAITHICREKKHRKNTHLRDDNFT